MQTLAEPIDPITIAEGYRVERFSVDQLDCLCYLFTAVYGKLPPKQRFLKKYNTAFTVVNYTGFFAYSADGLPVAFYGVIPCFIEYNGHLVLAAQSADTMTDPAHRNKGLFVALAELTYSLCRKEGIRLIFGFPNQHSLPGFINKLGWQQTEQLEHFTIPVKTIPLEKLTAKFSLLKPLYQIYVRLMLSNAEKGGIVNSALAESYAGVYRDEEFLAYKTYNETYHIKIGEITVWFKIQNGLQVGDVLGPLDKFDSLMKQLLKLTRKLGLSQLRFQVSGKTKLHFVLKRYAVQVPSFIVGVKDLGSGIPLQKLVFTFADIDIF